MKKDINEFINEFTTNFSELFVETFLIRFLSEFDKNDLLDSIELVNIELNKKMHLKFIKELKEMGFDLKKTEK